MRIRRQLGGGERRSGWTRMKRTALAILLFYGWCWPGRGAINRVQSDQVSGSSGATTIVSSVLTTHAGDLLVVGTRASRSVSLNDPPTISNVGGDTWNFVGGSAATACVEISANGADLLCLFYAENIHGSASDAITATWDDLQQFRVIFTIEYSGVKSSGSLDANPTPINSGGSSATSQSSNTFSTAQANEVIAGLAGTNSLSVSYTAGPESGGYAIVETASDNDAAMEDVIVSSIQSGVSASMSASSAVKWGIVVASFEAASAGGGAGVFDPSVFDATVFDAGSGTFYSRNGFEGFGLAINERVAMQSGLSRSAAEGGAVFDRGARGYGVLRSAWESGWTGNPAARIAGASRASFESIAIVEAASRAATYARTRFEGPTRSDFGIRGFQFLRTPLEGGGPAAMSGGIASRIAAMSRGGIEAAAISDRAARQLGYGRATREFTGFGQERAVRSIGLTRIGADRALLLDSASRQASTQRQDLTVSSSEAAPVRDFGRGFLIRPPKTGEPGGRTNEGTVPGRVIEGTPPAR